ncbi:MAG: hypothetical protein P8Z78_14715 [Gammaproteobacteria bacterium]|jgi:hypothetical protein
MSGMDKIRLAAVVASLTLAMPLSAAPFVDRCQENWISKSDEAFAADCADMAFNGDLEERQKLAWMFFTRVNQLIEDAHGVSDSGRVPQWMAWATDNDTFGTTPDYQYKRENRDDLVPVTEKKLLAGGISMDEPDGANEETTRNAVAYDYITRTAKLNTKQGVLDYIKAGNRVDMPVGSVEMKASWLRVPPGGAPDGALTFKFKSGTYWWRGLHIMVKMKPLPKDENLFYTKEPSWFWTTFEFNDNPGVGHVREKLITQRAPLSREAIESFLEEGGIAGFGFEAYAPNGTQISYTVDGEGNEPVILGHTDMEDFAGSPNTAQPRYWTSFNASCHTCHATAAINPETETYFPFSVPAGALTPQYYGAEKDGTNLYLGDGFVPLDFMWPISFHAK